MVQELGGAHWLASVNMSAFNSALCHVAPVRLRCKHPSTCCRLTLQVQLTVLGYGANALLNTFLKEVRPTCLQVQLTVLGYGAIALLNTFLNEVGPSTVGTQSRTSGVCTLLHGYLLALALVRRNCLC